MTFCLYRLVLETDHVEVSQRRDTFTLEIPISPEDAQWMGMIHDFGEPKDFNPVPLINSKDLVVYSNIFLPSLHTAKFSFQLVNSHFESLEISEMHFSHRYLCENSKWISRSYFRLVTHFLLHQF